MWTSFEISGKYENAVGSCKLPKDKHVKFSRELELTCVAQSIDILTDNLLQEVENFKFKNFAGVLQEFFRVTPSNLSTSTTQLSYELSNLQEQKIIDHITKLMDLDVVLKIGNCGNYDRQLFDTISGIQDQN